MTCSELEAALKELTPYVYENAAPPDVTEYIVWAVYGYAAIVGDDGVQIRIPRVQIDAYSQGSGAELEGGFFDTLMDALDALPLAYSVEDVGYDHDAAAMRLILQCDVC